MLKVGWGECGFLLYVVSSLDPQLILVVTDRCSILFGWCGVSVIRVCYTVLGCIYLAKTD